MNLTNTFRVLGRHKVLLIFGILIAAFAAFATAFRIETGTLAPRTEVPYEASTQVLVSDPSSVFSSRSAPAVIPPGQTAPGARDLAALTVVYAYLAQSTEIRTLVEAQIGALGDDEDLTADQRTTQPTSTVDTGTFKLPILEITGTANSPARAESIASTAGAVFLAYATAQQDAALVSPENRIQLRVITAPEAEPAEGANPALPIVAVGVGVLLAMLALIFAVDNARRTRSDAGPQAAETPVRPAARQMPQPVFPRDGSAPQDHRTGARAPERTYRP